MTDKRKKVGYKSPPQEHQFKKGRSGNPKGRPRRSKNANDILDAELGKTMTIIEQGVEVRISKREAFVASLVNDAIRGVKAARPLLLKVLALQVPTEPFEANPDDDAILAAYLKSLKPEEEPDEDD